MTLLGAATGPFGGAGEDLTRTGTGRRLLPARADGGTETLSRHLERHGPLPFIDSELARERAIREVDRAGLVGRGGAAYPTAKKLRAVAQSGRRAVVVANGSEGEPASGKDKALLATSPQLVLDGAAIAARLVRAGEVIVVVHHAVRSVVDAAVDERRQAGLEAVPMRVVTAIERFVAGEASAVVHYLERGVPLPRETPPRVADRGLHGRPTLVQNVETLAHLALIARHGAAWYRSIGTDAEPGSTLVTILGAVERPGVYEIALGTPTSGVLAEAGGPSVALGALLIGGYFGTWARLDDVLGLEFDSRSLSRVGARVGAGLVAALPRSACGLIEASRVVRYLASESTGQCGPCVFGLDAIATELERLANGIPIDLRRLVRWLNQVEGRGACSHPDGVVRFVRSTLAVFSDDVERHQGGSSCRSSGQATFLPATSGGQ